MKSQDYVFISFSSKDATTADTLRRELERLGVACWISLDCIPLAEGYPKAILDALDSAGAVLVVLTPAANESPHVEREIERAGSRNLPIVAYRRVDVKLSKTLEYFISMPQWFDATKGKPAAHAKLLAPQLRQLLSGKRPLAEPVDSNSAKNRRPLIMAGFAMTLVIVLLAAALFGGWFKSGAEGDDTESVAPLPRATIQTAVGDTVGPESGLRNQRFPGILRVENAEVRELGFAAFGSAGNIRTWTVEQMNEGRRSTDAGVYEWNVTSENGSSWTVLVLRSPDGVSDAKLDRLQDGIARVLEERGEKAFDVEEGCILEWEKGAWSPRFSRRELRSGDTETLFDPDGPDAVAALLAREFPELEVFGVTVPQVRLD